VTEPPAFASIQEHVPRLGDVASGGRTSPLHDIGILDDLATELFAV